MAWEPPAPGERKKMLGYVIDAHLERAGPKRQIEMCFQALKRSQLLVRAKQGMRVRFAIEDFVLDKWDAQKDMIRREFKAVREATKNEAIHLEFLKRKKNKFDRIDTLHLPIANGWLAFNKTLPPEFLKQMSLYPTGEYLDAPDSLEGALQFPVRTHKSTGPITGGTKLTNIEYAS